MPRKSVHNIPLDTDHIPFRHYDHQNDNQIDWVSRIPGVKKLPDPANDNTPVPVNPGDMRVPTKGYDVRKFIPDLYEIWFDQTLPGQVGGIVDNNYNFFRDPTPYKMPATGGWVKIFGYCGFPYRNEIKGWVPGGPIGNVGCVAGQAIANTEFWPPLVEATDRGVLLTSRGPGTSFQNHAAWNRPAGAVGPQDQPFIQHVMNIPEMPFPNPFREVDPNTMRNSAPSPFVGVPVPLEVQSPAPGQRPVPGVSSETMVTVSVGGALGVQTNVDKFPVARPPSPPPRNQKPDKKTLAKKIAVVGVEFMDVVSEYGDIVGAVFEALPKHIQKKTNDACKKRGPGDSFGQYGIGCQDLKLRTIYNNWHLLNAEDAWQNIARNSLEDMFHGAVQKHLPKQWINANKQADKAFADLVNDTLDFIGLGENANLVD